MTKLSKPAEAVWEAVNQDEPGVFVDYGDCLAAALRATALYCKRDRLQLLAIADELEGQHRERGAASRYIGKPPIDW